jgi:hypothetical protein
MDTIPDLTFVQPDPDLAFYLSPAGDFDGDGYADLAVGSNLGRVDVVWGGAHLSVVATTVLTGEDLNTGQGSCAGDLSGDGIADLVVGAPGFFLGPGLAGPPGRVTVILGDPGRLARERLLIAGPQASDFFGFAVTARNDIDGDGYSDLVVGAPLTDDTLGAIYVYRGGPSPSINADLALRGTVPGSQFGRYIAATGDLDGDGFSDLAVGAPAIYSNTPGVFGRVYVYAGADADLSRSPVTLTQGQTGDYFGGPVASAPP